MLGSSSKSRRGPTIHVDYLIHIQEIKPWPPSQSLRSVRSVLIQWENGERNSGSTNTVSPTPGSVAVEGKIEFNESFKLPVNLVKDVSVKGKDVDVFMKNVLELNLYEPRREKIQLLGTAIVDLAECGIIKETLDILVPMTSKRSIINTAQPILFLKIDRVYKVRNNASSRGNLSQEHLLDRKGSETVSALMDEEYAEEAEVASFTDDDVSSHSSLTVCSSTLESNGGSLPQIEENGSVSPIDCKGEAVEEHALASQSDLERTNAGTQITQCEVREHSKVTSFESSVDACATASKSYSTTSPVEDNVISNKIHLSSSSLANGNTQDATETSMKRYDHEDLSQNAHEMVANKGTTVTYDVQSKEGTSDSSKAKMEDSANSPQVDKQESGPFSDSLDDREDDRKVLTNEKISSKEATDAADEYEWQENGHEGPYMEAKRSSTEDEQLNIHSQENHLSQVNLGTKSNALKSDRLKHVKSVRSSVDSVRSNGLFSNNHLPELQEACVLGDRQHGPGTLINKSSNESNDAKVYPKDTRSALLDKKILQLENKIMTLEGELRDAAAIEAALFSVVAEHGSSRNKVHAPARRLSRLYLHVCKEGIQSRRASAARSAVSGLALVAKACGNDVPKLTFWLSNSVVLRVIISETIGDLDSQLSAGPMERNGGGKEKKHASSPLKWKESSSGRKESKLMSYGSFSDWESPVAFTSALVKVEAWIFSRIIESVWWQTLTPHMQSAARVEIDRGMGTASGKNFGRVSSTSNQDQMNFSLDHWKSAFRDACERLCPVRAAGHECGCLHLLSRLIMEQCVSRLDVAMFNAVLRDSGDEIPTDPVSDPISDLLVLPIPAGEASFGAGAQLKNAIGNWSRWLTDLFGIDDENDQYGSNDRQDTSVKPFHLLNSLSDLMMLPKDMLLSRSIREEVCSTFGPSLIKRVIDYFVPDEFCPDPVPNVVLEALEAEDPGEAREGFVTNFPYAASPPAYLPPSASSVASIIGEVGSQSQLRRSGSSVLRKSYTSDDELDELNSPLASIFIDGFRSSSVQSKPNWISKGNYQNAIRYELLRDVWMKSE
ncbi:UPF0481 protein [Hibiscus syriacus]|uniref:UPF0481 protein n=1 Tax=Hibiscus syriacus TaxID=106335 RepID=A0A6A3BPF9_HIBSY|nr:uncharacterized protein LOC120212512 [Hibiscus syriacus]KAE8718474.1 UPF0481 protein [Hibiscus syriacus]